MSDLVGNQNVGFLASRLSSILEQFFYILEILMEYFGIYNFIIVFSNQQCRGKNSLRKNDDVRLGAACIRWGHTTD